MPQTLTHWGRVTHICVSNLTTTGSDNGLSPGRRQAIIRTNTGMLLIRPLGTNFREILIGVQTFSFTKMELNMSSAKWRPFCLGLNVLSSLSAWWSVIIPLGCMRIQALWDSDMVWIVNINISMGLWIYKRYYFLLLYGPVSLGADPRTCHHYVYAVLSVARFIEPKLSIP